MTFGKWCGLDYSKKWLADDAIELSWRSVREKWLSPVRRAAEVWELTRSCCRRTAVDVVSPTSYELLAAAQLGFEKGGGGGGCERGGKGESEKRQHEGIKQRQEERRSSATRSRSITSPCPTRRRGARDPRRRARVGGDARSAGSAASTCQPAPRRGATTPPTGGSLRSARRRASAPSARPRRASTAAR